MPSAREPELIYRVFGRKLRELRKKMDVPQEELATMSGLSRASIANIENGKQRVFLHQLIQFAQVLRIDIGSLVPTKADPQIMEEEADRAQSEYLKKLRKMTDF